MAEIVLIQSLIRGYLTRRERTAHRIVRRWMRRRRDMRAYRDIRRQHRHRTHVAREMLTTERAYYGFLGVIIDTFKRPLEERGAITEEGA